MNFLPSKIYKFIFNSCFGKKLNIFFGRDPYIIINFSFLKKYNICKVQGSNSDHHKKKKILQNFIQIYEFY